VAEFYRCLNFLYIYISLIETKLKLINISILTSNNIYTLKINDTF